MPVHYAGQACRMDEILDIAPPARPPGHRGRRPLRRRAYKGRPVGGLGDATVFSFYAIKNMTTGEGGMVTTDDAELAEQVRILRNHGLDANAWNRYSAAGIAVLRRHRAGLQLPHDRLQAALGLRPAAAPARVQRPPRRTRGAATRSAFDEIAGGRDAGHRPEVDDELAPLRHRLRSRASPSAATSSSTELKQRGIGTAVHFLPVHYHPYYRETFGFKPGDYPVAEAEFERLISLPLFPQMTDADVDRVVEPPSRRSLQQHRA